MVNDAVAHFRKVDPILSRVLTTIPTFESFVLTPSTNYFQSLCREIIGQQLGSKAATAIFSRFVTLFPDGVITPDRVDTLSEDQIRAIGTSWGKARFIKDLASKVMSRTVQLENLHVRSDAEVFAELTKVKGIGPWTVDMFLMFTLAREDIFSFGDLGLQNSIARVYKLRKKPTRQQMERISQKWTPYRTYACLFLWHALDNTPKL